MMENKIKNILAFYTKIPVDNINADTVIDRSAVSNSILLHQLYAKLRSENIEISNYWDIKTFGDLLRQVDESNGNIKKNENVTSQEINDIYCLKQSEPFSIGIDVEKIENMPVVNDFREDNFYTMNFSTAEIAYCILQPNSFASFAGLFAAKEAIIKANNLYQNKEFRTININHLPSGKPFHTEFQLSISHTDDLAIAIAVKLNDKKTTNPQDIIQGKQTGMGNFIIYFLLIFSLLLSFLTLLTGYLR